MNKKEIMYDRIKNHGEQLKNIFNLDSNIDPVKLCKKLFRLENKAHRLAEDGCNGFAIPMIYQGDIAVGEIENEIMYKMYRTYVPTYAKVDIWLCE